MDINKHLTDTPEQMLHKIKERRFLLSMRKWVALPIILLLIAAIIWGVASIPYVCIYGDAMEPLFTDGDLCIAIPAQGYRAGDIIAFSRNGKVLARRIIAGPGSSVAIDENGIVTVDGAVIDAPYGTQPALGQCNIAFPYIVSDGQYFVLGDNRADAVDSRSTAFGCVEEREIIGRLTVRIWPFSEFQLFRSQEA